MSKLKFKPLGDRVLVLVDDKKIETKTTSGILLPESAVADQTKIGTVAAVGPGLYTQAGMLIPMSVREGDTVVLPPFSNSYEMKIDGVTYQLFRESDLLGIQKS